MNILFLFYAPIVPYIGGIQRVTENLAVELQKREHNIYYLNIDKKQSDYGYQFPVPQLYIDYSPNTQLTYIDYVDILKKYNIDIIINQEAREDLLNILSYTPKGIKRITCIHLQPFYCQTFYKEFIKSYNLPGMKAKLYKAYCTLFPSHYYNKTLQVQKKTLQRTIEVSDYVCLLSERFISRIKKYMPDIDESKFKAVNNPNTFNNLNDQTFEKKKQILWVGRHENTPKNFPLFVDFWTKFVKIHPDWEAIVLGEGKDWNYNKKYAIRKSARNISFVGNKKNVSHFYKDASFIVVTSYYEGWGMILTEAMNYGCIPCAFDTYESLHDIVENNDVGLVIPPFDENLMVTEISFLINNPEAMNRMRNCSRIKVMQFSVEKIVDKWESLLKSI